MKTIQINGTIVDDDDAWIYDFFGIRNISPGMVKKELEEANGDEVTLEINSGGGDLFAGNEIYYMIRAYGPYTRADITALAASAATVVACGADTVRASPGMQYMIHNVSCGAQGDYRTMDHASAILQNANRAVSNIYQLKTGMSEKDLLKLMDEETWMEAKRAVELGFVDEIIGDMERTLAGRSSVTVYNSVAQILSEEVKDRIRQTIKVPEGKQNMQIERKRLELLRLKGERKNVYI